jgi:hypothetical protein
MVRQVNVTDAESCWEDGFSDDDGCEKYLQQQKAAKIADDVETGDEEEPETVDDVAEDEPVAEAAEDLEEDDSEDEADNEDEPAEEEADATLEANPKGSKMPKTKAVGKTTKAESIRAVIEARKASGVELRPRDIIETLKKKGIEVNASQVSITLRAMGVPAAKRGGGAKPKSKPTAAIAETTGEHEKTRPTAKFRAGKVAEKLEPAAGTLSGDMLATAAEFMHAAGSYDHAIELLGICKKVIQRS